ncbi:MAG: fimbria/pilus outer membrane usher protein [Sphingomonas fennica]
MLAVALLLAAAAVPPVAGMAGAGSPAGPGGVAPAVGETLFGQVWMNGVDTGLIVEFTRDGARLNASRDDLRQIGLDVPAGDGAIGLDTLAGVRWTIDAPTQTVRITAEPGAMHAADLAGPSRTVRPRLASWGALLNYSFYGDRVDDHISGGATVEARVFGPAGSLSTSAVVRALPGGGVVGRRLETRYVLEDPGSMRRLTIGDFVATDGSAEGAVRAGGIQLTTDFSLQPDLITAPMPHLSGGRGVPSTVDLYVNGVRSLSQNVQAGRFTVSNIPVVDGAGRVSLLVRDVLGRESVQHIAFYGTHQLLREGLSASSVQAGLLRVDAFGPGDRYGMAFASGAFRRGVTDHVTAEVRAVAADAVQAAGTTVTAKLGEVAVASLAADVSASGAGRGGQMGITVRRDAGHFSLYAGVQKTIGSYATLASIGGEGLFALRVQAGGSFQSTEFGSLGVSVTRVRTAFGDSRIVAGSWSKPIGPRIAAFASLIHSRAVGSELLATAGLTMALSPRASANVQATRDRRGWSGAAGWSQAAPLDGGVAWRAAASAASGQSRLLGGATLRGQAGEVGADVALGSGTPDVRVFASGAAVWLGGAQRMTASVGESFAMIETGRPDVGIAVENRPAGRTGRDGRLFIPNLPAHAAARITLDYDGIGLDSDVDHAEIVLGPHGSGGSVVRMPVHPVRAVSAQILWADGTPVPLGSVVLRADGREDVVGYDGLAYMTDVGETVTADVRAGAATCRIAFTVGSSGPVTCHAA